MTESPEREADTSRDCPRCGKALAPGQDWCLECGAAATTRIVGSRRWKLAAIATGLLLLLLAGGAAAAFIAATDNGPIRVKTTTEAAPLGQAITVTSSTTTPLTPTQASTATTPVTPATTATTATPTAATPTTSTPTSAAAIAPWPGGEGWTVILFAGSKTDVDQRAKQISSTGLPVSVIDGNTYSGVDKGRFAVAGGKFDTKTQAVAFLAQVGKIVPAGGKVAQIKPR